MYGSVHVKFAIDCFCFPERTLKRKKVCVFDIKWKSERERGRARRDGEGSDKKQQQEPRNR